MARKRRTRLEIIADILAVLSTGCRPPTRLATEANLAYDRMAKIMESLVEKGLVREDAGVYCITQEGHRLLEAYRQWRNFLDAVGI
ncbi:winged helix-turn-helix domain-containing protein [Pyrobaculum neutrophilum]|uniref:ArnR1-like winged helix-turn-helix domain-containing protein n=1 Tax=Pyrobaculum neutrophilum (strain DSM 2338 / JCM 9278 / NBRC 100436 / V24Sta) TaxID=444157 RepID=B1YDL3_PYRNV|nr:winged helix-turn-helix domain-containing protein [Pyrobaculum neutrophilum]ACB39876.1 conserved hypothetical protein [Pyrobaculum neutrophilum V24Sta]